MTSSTVQLYRTILIAATAAVAVIQPDVSTTSALVRFILRIEENP
jgi:hypothetical protein